MTKTLYQTRTGLVRGKNGKLVPRKGPRVAKEFDKTQKFAVRRYERYRLGFCGPIFEGWVYLAGLCLTTDIRAQVTHDSDQAWVLPDKATANAVKHALNRNLDRKHHYQTFKV